ncbi:MAG: hypothetical protein U0Q16_23020 [Bryobacteraceae bacterium]
MAFALPCAAQLNRQNISTILGFENGTPGAFPAGWSASSARDAVIDESVAHGGRYSARLDRGPSSGGAYSDLQFTIPVDFAGQTIELRGFLKTESVVGRAQLVVAERAVQSGPNIELASSQAINGTTDWREYRVSLPATPSAKFLTVQLFMPATTGRAWFDDLQLLVDGKPIAEAATGVPSGTPSSGSTAPQLTRHNVSGILGFENGTPGAFPAGWDRSGPAQSVFVDDAVVHGGRYSARIERGPSTALTFSDLQFTIPVDFAGQTIELRGFIKTESVAGQVKLNVSERAVQNGPVIETGSSQALSGTTDWTEYRVIVAAVPAAKFLQVQLIMPAAAGKAWFDDLELLVDGRSIAEAADGIPGGLSPQQLTRQNISGILGFENGTPRAFPAGWTITGGAPVAVIDDAVVHGGKYSARIERSTSSSGSYSDLFAQIPVDFAGKTLELRAFVKTESVFNQVLFGFAARAQPTVILESQNVMVYGSGDWKEYRVSIPAVPETKLLNIQLYLEGPGKVWFDDLQLLVDGKPIAEVPNGTPSGEPSGAAGSTLYQRTARNVTEIMDFENGTPGAFPAGWRSNGPADVVTDETVVHRGKYSARFERKPSSVRTFTDLFVMIPVDFAGKTIELRAFAKTEDLTGQIAINLLGSSQNRPPLEGNSWHLPYGGTTDWTEYRLRIPAAPEADDIYFQLYMNGTGKVWFDDLQLLVDGKPIADAPAGIPSGIPTSQPLTRQEVSDTSGFENGTPGLLPDRWSDNLSGAVAVDDAVAHSGAHSVRIERGPFSTGENAYLSMTVPMDFAARKIEVRVFAKTENVSGFVHLSVFERASEGGPFLDAATAPSSGVVRGTTDWKELRTIIPARADAKLLLVRLYLWGTGKVWFDDVQVLVDGRPLVDAPDGEPQVAPLTSRNISEILGFENGTPGETPFQWGANGAGDTTIDSVVFHGGSYSAHVQRGPSSVGEFGGIVASIPMDFAGKTIELRGFAKTENVSSSIGMYLREDGVSGPVEFATTQGLGVKGTTSWTEYSVSLPLVSSGKTLFVVATLFGTGHAWFDDLQLLVDGKPVALAPLGVPSGVPTPR